MTISHTPTDQPPRVKLWRRPFRIVRENLRVYLILNAAAYGLAFVGFGLGLLFPDLVAAQAAGLEADGTSPLVRQLFLNAPLFALVILGVNVFKLSVLHIVLPSLIVPFAGLPIFGYWAVDTGITLVGQSPQGGSRSSRTP